MGAESEYKGISPSIICDIERIIGVVERTKEKYGHGCAVLLGAGCSATAQIPMAATFVQWIETDFNHEYVAACKVCLTRNRTEPNYFDCMEQLPDGDQADLIRRAMEDSRMNWAHIALAQLMQTGHIDRVLTTNFDPLMVKACALLNFFPAVYDIAASSDFVPSAVADSAVFYLHGQSTGWKLLNRLDESGELTDRIRDVVKEVIGDRPLIVVGYNGAEDPVCRALFELRSYRRGLYWIGYKNELPDNYVISNILKPAKSARFLTSSGADSFFVTLARKLSSFPPNFVEAPFTHLQDLLSKIQDFSDEKSTVDILDLTRRWIQSAIMRFEIGEEDASQTRDTLQEDKLAAEAMTAYASGDYDKAISFFRNITARGLTLVEIDALAWSYIGIGNNSFKKAQRAAVPNEQIRLFEQAAVSYSEALKIKPDMHEALYNWGNSLGQQAMKKQGEEAYDLCALACEKYQQALYIKSDYSDAIDGWGAAILRQLSTKPNLEQEVFLLKAEHMLLSGEAIEKGSCSYNLACVAARRDQTDQALEWLRLSMQTGNLPKKKHITEDLDFELIRDDPKFIEFLNSLPE